MPSLPSTTTDCWNQTCVFLRTKTLLWSTARYQAAFADPLVRMLHREVIWYWQSNNVPAMIRSARGYCRAVLRTEGGT